MVVCVCVCLCVYVCVCLILVFSMTGLRSHVVQNTTNEEFLRYQIIDGTGTQDSIQVNLISYFHLIKNDWLFVI
jgi:hypothetical protein